MQNSHTNTITILDGCSEYKSANISGLLDFTSIINPETVKLTGSLEIKVRDRFQNVIAEKKTDVYY